MVQQDAAALSQTSPPKADKGKNPAAAVPAADASLPWVEKYRPKSLDELVSHADIVGTISRFIEENRMPHLLFYGPPGTGKTSAILACARRLYGTQYKSMMLELNASDDRGIDVVREQIRSFASTRKMFESGFKLIVLDEADAMTQPAQAALRRMIEKYTRNVRFCIICNYVGKIIPALQSRCTRFRFSPLAREQMQGRLDHVVAAEGVRLTPDGASALLRLARGDMRRVLNVLQACHAAAQSTPSREVNADLVYRCTGSPLPSDIEAIVKALLNSTDLAAAFAAVSQIMLNRGYALSDVLTDVFAFVMGLELPPAARVFMIEQLAEAEQRLAGGCSQQLQLGALVGAFRIGSELVGKH